MEEKIFIIQRNHSTPRFMTASYLEYAAAGNQYNDSPADKRADSLNLTIKSAEFQRCRIRDVSKELAVTVYVIPGPCSLTWFHRPLNYE
ncbi:hypothetical protein ABVT39_026764 [Epinephelus coioides]